VPATQFAQVHQFKRMMSHYQRTRDLIAVGAYVAGSDPAVDAAIERHPALQAFLQQAIDVRVDYASAVNALTLALGE